MTAFLLTRKGVHAKSSAVGLHGPVNKMARASSRSSQGGGSMLYILGTADSKATIFAFILRIPDATFMNAQVWRTLAISNFSTKERSFRTSGTLPIQRLLARASLGILSLRTQLQQSLQMAEQE